MYNPRNEALLNEVLRKCERLVNKNYLDTLHNLTFCPLPNTSEAISLLKIEKLEEPLSSEFFTFILNALGNLEEVFGYVIQSFNHKLTLYVGLKGAKSSSAAVELLKNGLKSSYPNSKFRELSPNESSLILMDLFDSKCYQALSSAVVIPNNTSSSNAPINQKLIDLMGNEAFTAFFLATPILRSEIKCLIDELKDLYTQLSSFSETGYDFSHTLSKNAAIHITDSRTETNTVSCTQTQGTEHAYSNSHYTLITPGAVIPLPNSNTLSISISFNQTSGIVNIDNQFIAKAEIKACSDTHTKLHITSTTDTKSDSLSYTTENKRVIDLLAKLEALIARLTLAKNEALFCFGAYFIAASSATSIRAAFTYSGLARDKELNSEEAFIMTWEKSESIFPKLIEELRNFNHFSFAAKPQGECMITAEMITPKELLNSFYFPYSSRIVR